MLVSRASCAHAAPWATKMKTSNSAHVICFLNENGILINDKSIDKNISGFCSHFKGRWQINPITWMAAQNTPVERVFTNQVLDFG
jgi:hypothetical protein